MAPGIQVGSQELVGCDDPRAITAPRTSNCSTWNIGWASPGCKLFHVEHQSPPTRTKNVPRGPSGVSKPLDPTCPPSYSPAVLTGLIFRNSLLYMLRSRFFWIWNLAALF